MSNTYNEKEIERALNNATGSMRLSGFEITGEERELIKRKMKGEITHEEFLDLVLQMAKGELKIHSK